MKLVRFARGDTASIGKLTEAGVIDLSDVTAGASMNDVIRDWRRLQGGAQAAISAAIALADVRLLAPIPQPEKILAIGLNYADHIAESGLPTPTEQVWFCKQPNALHGPYDAIEIPSVSNKVDYEVELVAVIGKGGRHIARDEAASHVFGYCIGNDVSVRDWQTKTPQWMLGKSFDTHAPIGPWVTTADEVGDPHRLDIKCFVNGDLRQSSNTKHLIFNVWDQIHQLSQAMTLKPGDLIFTGTPGGVGFAMTPPRFLSAGDKVRCEIGELGAIEATLAPEIRHG